MGQKFPTDINIPMIENIKSTLLANGKEENYFDLVWKAHLGIPHKEKFL